jgi:hypothetical protein
LDQAFAALAFALGASDHSEVRRLEVMIGDVIQSQPMTFLKALNRNWDLVGQQRLSFLLGAINENEGLRLSEKASLLESRWQAVQFVVDEELLDVRQICLEELANQLRNLDGFWDESYETPCGEFLDECQSRRDMESL